jgi:tetratricopeptide (TPR) repeat protein
MRQRLIGLRVHRQPIITALSVLCFPAGIAAITFLIVHVTAFAFLPGQTHAQFGPALAIVSSPTPSTSGTLASQDSQAQQLLAEAQNDITIANDVVTFTGVFVSIVAAAVAIAGFLEIRGLRQIEAHMQQVTNLERQIERQIEQLAQRSEREKQMFEERLERLDQRYESESRMFEERLEQVAQHFESESQNFMEASFNFNQGKEAYLMGDDVHAIEYFSLALELQPNNARILERLGRTYSNLNDMKQAINYLEQALSIDPSNVAALRSLALCYRYTDPQKAIEYLNQAFKVHPYGYEALDFLGLIYRDQGLIDEAIAHHEKALTIKKRPETEFYLSLLYAKKGDKKGAKIRALSADYDTYKQEHDKRIRPVWKILIQSGVHIIDGNKEEALRLIQASTQYITTQRIYEGLKDHLQFFLEATDHAEWIPEFMEFVQLQEK